MKPVALRQNPQPRFGAGKKDADLAALPKNLKQLVEIFERETKPGKRLYDLLGAYNHSFAFENLPGQEAYRAALLTRIKRDIQQVTRQTAKLLSREEYGRIKDLIARPGELPADVQTALRGIDEDRITIHAHPKAPSMPDPLEQMRLDAEAASRSSRERDWWPTPEEEAAIQRYEAEKKKQGW